MFEIIGLFLGATVFFGMSAVLGALFGVVAWVSFRQRKARLRRTLLAAAVPPLCAIYMAVCLILSPSVSLFGDISEPLPNGYVLKALGKMPEYAEIEGKTPLDSPQAAGWIGKVDLESTTLFGTYSELFSSQGSHASSVLKPCCFAFDTQSKTIRNFDSAEQMQSFAGKPVRLVEVQDFRSQDLAHIQFVRTENRILFIPPLVLVAGVWIFLLMWRPAEPIAETI